MKKIIFIDKNHRSKTRIVNKIIVIVMIITAKQILTKRKMTTIKNIFDDDLRKRFVFENVIVKIYSNNIIFHVDVDLIYFDDDENVINEKSHIKKMLNIVYKSVRSIRKLISTKNEFEIEMYNKKYFESIFTKEIMSFSFFLFIDDFEVYRNMYKTLKAFY